MKTPSCILMTALAAICTAPSFAADRAAADSLAMSATVMANKGNSGQAKELFYKALANDETCPDAIFELAKIFDKENNSAAASDFYQRASLIFAQENKTNTMAKRAEADKRVKALNPFAPRVAALYEDYAQELDRLTKKVPDSVTQDAAFARVTELKMPSVLAPEKLPKFYAALQAQKTAAATAEADSAKTASTKRPGFSSSIDPAPAKVVNNVPPEVERELKALGWGTITGTWVKKAANTYEVTDGKLEAAKTNGGVDVWVVKGTGAVKVTVRNDFNLDSSSSFFSDYNSTGYGVIMKSKECKVYAPGGYSGYSSATSKMEPYMVKTEPLPDINPRNHATVTIVDGKIEIAVNEKNVIRYNDKTLPRSGPFVIEVKGTATIENPRCAGQ